MSSRPPAQLSNEEPSEPSSRSRRLWLILGLVATIALYLGLIAVTNDEPAETSELTSKAVETPTPTPTLETTPVTVEPAPQPAPEPEPVEPEPASEDGIPAELAEYGIPIGAWRIYLATVYAIGWASDEELSYESNAASWGLTAIFACGQIREQGLDAAVDAEIAEFGDPKNATRSYFEAAQQLCDASSNIP